MVLFFLIQPFKSRVAREQLMKPFTALLMGDSLGIFACSWDSEGQPKLSHCILTGCPHVPARCPLSFFLAQQLLLPTIELLFLNHI